MLFCGDEQCGPALPAELHVLILSFLTDVRDLAAVCCTSRLAYTVVTSQPALWSALVRRHYAASGLRCVERPWEDDPLGSWHPFIRKVVASFLGFDVVEPSPWWSAPKRTAWLLSSKRRLLSVLSQQLAQREDVEQLELEPLLDTVLDPEAILKVSDMQNEYQSNRILALCLVEMDYHAPPLIPFVLLLGLVRYQQQLHRELAEVDQQEVFGHHFHRSSFLGQLWSQWAKRRARHFLDAVVTQTWQQCAALRENLDTELNSLETDAIRLRETVQGCLHAVLRNLDKLPRCLLLVLFHLKHLARNDRRNNPAAFWFFCRLVVPSLMLSLDKPEVTGGVFPTQQQQRTMILVAKVFQVAFTTRKIIFMEYYLKHVGEDLLISIGATVEHAMAPLLGFIAEQEQHVLETFASEQAISEGAKEASDEQALLSSFLEVHQRGLLSTCTEK
ncbi:hypothetical protein QOT17_004190 [Balamuthia mandrillaris]